MVVLMVALLPVSSRLAQGQTEVRVGVLVDMPSSWVTRTLDTLDAELVSLAGSEFRFFTRDRVRHADGSRAGVRTALQALFADTSVDIVVALGPVGSDVGREMVRPTPFIAAAVISAEGQGFPATDAGTSGASNLHYLSAKVDLLEELLSFRDSVAARRITVAVERSIFEGVPIVERSLTELESDPSLDLELALMDYGPNAVPFEELIPADVDSVFMLPQLSRDEAERQAQVNTLLERGLPSLSTMGEEDAAAGFLYSIALIPQPERLARRLAIDIRDIALGRAPEDLQVGLTPRKRLVVNLATARALGQEVPFSIRFEAELLNERRGDIDQLTMDGAVAEALIRNLDIAVAEAELESSTEQTRISRADLLPQLSAGVAWEKSDEDLLVLPEVIPDETTTASLNLSQTIYSESILSNYRSTEFLQEADRAGRDAVKLDVVQSTATAYLNLLVAKTEREIQRDNIRLTRANLDRARFRYRVGSADRSEVFRFETELASDLQAIARTQSAFQQSVFELNQVLRRPIGAELAVKETGVDDPPVFGDPRLEAFISGPSGERMLADFLTLESNANAPELEELDAQIASQERLLLAARRRRYVPDINLVASVEEVVDDSGAPMARNYNEDWQVGVELTLPLYEGSSIAAEQRQARVLLRRLRLLREQTGLALETAARNSVAEASASRLNIAFAKRSEQAARNTLELVTDSYTRGRSNYIDLIDAQNSYLTERLASANAVYEYLLDLIDLQRAIGFFDFSVDEATKQAWFDRLDAFAGSES